MTREILRDHTSHSWAALNKWAYIPTAVELAMWDKFELENSLKRKHWRPWTDPRNNSFKPQPVETSSEHAQRMARRDKLKQRFHITD